MNKFPVFFLALILSAGFVMAQDEGIGLSAGLEFGIDDITEAAGDRIPYLMPMLIYDNSFFDEAFDLYAELDYTFGFTKIDDEFPQLLYFDVALGYNLGLGDMSTLSFLVENEVNDFIISPRESDFNNVDSVILTPGVKFTQTLGIGDVYIQAGTPVTYIQNDEDADAEIGVDVTLGWESAFGLGLELKELNMVKTEGDKGYAGLEATVSYENGPVYAEVEVDIPKEIDENGLVIIPEFDFSMSAFTFYVNCEFANVAADSGDIAATPALGIKYSF